MKGTSVAIIYQTIWLKGRISRAQPSRKPLTLIRLARHSVILVWDNARIEAIATLCRGL